MFAARAVCVASCCGLLVAPSVLSGCSAGGGPPPNKNTQDPPLGQSGGSGPAGGNGPSASSGNIGGASGAALKGPILRDSRCVLEFGQSYFEIDPNVAGRIVSAKSAGQEVLSSSEVHDGSYGSTFWTAPQSDWGWPPIEGVDSVDYSVESDPTSCSMTSPKVAGASQELINDIVIVKRFSADLAKEALVIEYTIRNEGAESKRFAPWELTRVAPGGLTFFATDAEPTGMEQPPIVKEAGAVWYQDDASVENGSKLFSDGKGWIAHVTPDHVLLLKSFPDIPIEQAAPEQGEVEIYVANPESGKAGSARYVEVENLGPHAEIAAGASQTWTVRWYLRPLPAEPLRSPGSAELLTRVQELLAP